MGVREAGLAFVPWVLFNAPRVLALALSPAANAIKDGDGFTGFDAQHL